MENNRKINLNPLPYSYADLEPYVSEQTMKVHHIRHLGGYTKALNEMLSKINSGINAPLSTLYTYAHKLHSDPERLRFLIGAVYNHNLYFSLLSPPQNDAITRPGGELLEAIEKGFASFEKFTIEFASKAISTQGSGWTYRCKDKKGNARIISVKNHDIPNLAAYSPIAVIDMWEHAYYLDHLDRRRDYVTDYFRIINWKLSELRWNCKIVFD